MNEEHRKAIISLHIHLIKRILAIFIIILIIFCLIIFAIDVKSNGTTTISNALHNTEFAEERATMRLYSVSELCGKWIVSGVAGYNGIYGLEDNEIVDYIGLVFELQPQSFRIETQLYDNVSYELQLASLDIDISRGLRGSPFEALEFDKDFMEVIKVNIDANIEYPKSLSLNDLGCILYVKDANTLFAVKSGVYFELTRLYK
jgi:hypothetical protein